MTATAAAAADDIVRVGLADDEPDHIAECGPTGHAPEQGGNQADVQGAISLRRRVHDATVLSLIVLIQIAWLAALAYGTWLLA